MANGSDAEDFVVLSRVRTGLKREFEFALKAQSEIRGSLGRTRSRNAQNGPAWSPDNRSNKKLKKEAKVEKEKIDLEKSVRVEEPVDLMSEEEAKSDVVDVEEPKREVVGWEEEESKMVDLEKEEEVKDGVIEPMGEDEVDKEGKEISEPEKAVITSQEEKQEEEKKEEEKESKMDVDIREKESELENATKNVEEEKEDLVIKSESCKGDLGMPVLVSCEGNSKMEEVVKEEKPLRRFTRSLLQSKVETVKETAMRDAVVVDVSDAKSGGDDNRVEGVDNPMTQEMDVSTKYVRNFPTKLKDLFDSGMLDGVNVRYTRSSKVWFWKKFHR